MSYTFTNMAANEENISPENILKFKSAFVESVSRTAKQYNPEIFYPLVLSNCNGTGPWQFSDATIDYNKDKAFDVMLWYKQGYLDIAGELKGQEILKHEWKTRLERLINIVTENGDDHKKCLAFLLSDKVNEAMLKTCLAIHYFKPLVHDCSYLIDKSLECPVSCDLCSEKVEFGDTSFGHHKVWHGSADLVLQSSVVKVYKESADYEEGEEKEGDFRDTSQNELNESNDNIVDTEVRKVKKKEKKRKAKSEAIAQTIVNAFCEAKKDKSNFRKFIPSFMATESNIRIILYNCELDILLLSKKYPIWTVNEENVTQLNTRTLIQVWLTLNYSHLFDENIDQFLLQSTPKSKFKDVVGKAYSYYLNDVEGPLSTQDKYKDKLPYDVLSNKEWSAATKGKAEILAEIDSILQ